MVRAGGFLQGKALLAKPNPDANYFYLMLGELTKIGECMTSPSKIAGKNQKGNKHAMCSIRFIHIEDQSCLLSIMLLRKTASKISFEIISVSISFSIAI